MLFGVTVILYFLKILSGSRNYADLLYYLNQHLSGEPKDLIEGCLHMDPDKGYSEA